MVSLLWMMVLYWGTWKLESLVGKIFLLGAMKKASSKVFNITHRWIGLRLLEDWGRLSRGELPVWGQGLAELHLHREEWIFWKVGICRHKELQMSVIDSNPSPILSISSQWHCAVAVWPACAGCHWLFCGSSAMPCTDIHIVQKLKLLVSHAELLNHWKPCRVQMKGFYVGISHRLRSVPLELEWEP